MGQRTAVVDWRPHPSEMHTLRAFTGYLKAKLEGTSFGEGVLWRADLLRNGTGSEDEGGLGFPAGVEDARHAMGGACMGLDPRTSVVDPQLRMHGVENVYVASAAVFPDGQAQLPTMTLMALALRLAQTLQRGRV